MYAIEEMIDMPLNEGEKWKSDTHRLVASIISIGNPRITNADGLANNVRIINSLSHTKIVKVTVDDLEKMGVII